MANSRYGNIINIASDLGVIAPYQSLYEDHLFRKNSNQKPVTILLLLHGIIGKDRPHIGPIKYRCNALSPGGVFNNRDPNFLQKVSKLIPQRM